MSSRRLLPAGLALGHALHQEAVGLAGLFGAVYNFAEARIGLLVLHPGDARRLPRLHRVAADHPALGFVVVPEPLGVDVVAFLTDVFVDFLDGGLDEFLARPRFFIIIFCFLGFLLIRGVGGFSSFPSLIAAASSLTAAVSSIMACFITRRS